MENKTEIRIVSATADDVPEILNFIRELAVYEKLEHEVSATEESLRTSLFGERPHAEVLLLKEAGQSLGFALYFPNFSTFLGRAGLHLEDLYVRPHARGRGFGKALLACLAKLCLERNYGRLEWAVLDWNKPAIEFYLALNSIPMEGWTTHRLTGEALVTLAQRGFAELK